MMKSLNKGTKDYFKSEGTVSKWWNPEKGTYHFYYMKELQVLDEQFIVNPEWKVLDVCTGKGRFAIYFAKKGCKVTAVDISEEMLSIAKENARKEGVSSNINFILGDAENLSNIQNDYDIVCCMEALDHLPDIEKATREMSRKIKSGGFFLFTFVPESSLYWKFYWNIIIRNPKDSGIATAYSINYILEMLRRNNLSNPNHFGIGLFFPTGPLVSRMVLHVLARFETLIKKYYTRPSYINRCAHIIGWSVKLDSEG